MAWYTQAYRSDQTSVIFDRMPLMWNMSNTTNSGEIYGTGYYMPVPAQHNTMRFTKPNAYQPIYAVQDTNPLTANFIPIANLGENFNQKVKIFDNLYICLSDYRLYSQDRGYIFLFDSDVEPTYTNAFYKRALHRQEEIDFLKSCSYFSAIGTKVGTAFYPTVALAICLSTQPQVVMNNTKIIYGQPSSNTALNTTDVSMWLSDSGSLYISTQYDSQYEYTPPSDPYAGGGIAGPSGFPEATHDFTSDSVSPPTAPTIGAYDTGFTRIYTSDETHVRALATYLWTTSVDWTQVQKLVNKPWDLIMGLNILPVTPASEQEMVYIGNLEIPVLMGRATEQFVSVDCGTIEIPTRWGTYLDFSPYTKLEIYLPYIGMREINPDDVMGKTLGVKYVVDIMSGSCVCFLSAISEDTEGNPLVQVLYTYSGTCASQVPVTSAQYTGMMEGITQIATSIIALQGNPTTAPVAISNIASGIVNITKPSVQRSGAISGTSGLMDIQKPYVIFTVPRMCTPEGQDKFIGYPSFITETLGDLTGYTEIEDVHLEGIPCTLSELQEIEKALKDGVIL